MFPKGCLGPQKTHLSLLRLCPLFLYLTHYGCLFSHVLSVIAVWICSVLSVKCWSFYMLIKSKYGKTEEGFLSTLCHLCILGGGVLRKRTVKSEKHRVEQTWIHNHHWGKWWRKGIFPELFFCWIRKHITRSNKYLRRIRKEGCRWFQGECTTTVQPRAVGTATEMLRETTTGTSPKTNLKRSRKRGGNEEFIHKPLTQPATQALDCKLSLKERILPGV